MNPINPVNTPIKLFTPTHAASELKPELLYLHTDMPPEKWASLPSFGGAASWLGMHHSLRQRRLRGVAKQQDAGAGDGGVGLHPLQLSHHLPTVVMLGKMAPPLLCGVAHVAAHTDARALGFAMRDRRTSRLARGLSG